FEDEGGEYADAVLKSLRDGEAITTSLWPLEISNGLLVAEMGANVLDIHHRRGFADISVGDVEIVLQIEARGRHHVEEVIHALEDRGLKVEVDT
ncbi:MAG: hypothetical protein ABIF09_02735, partial [Gemmatimonadota bacterium]